MPFETGSVTFRVFDVESPLKTDVVAGFADAVAPPIDSLSSEPISGWVSPRFLFDLEITQDTAVSGGYVRTDLMKAERKVPPSLLRAYCSMEELAEMKARGVTHLNKQTRSEIKKRVKDELLPQMPPTLSSISMVLDTSHGRVYADAMSEKQMDAFCVNFKKATGTSAIQLTPEVAAMRLAQIDHRELSPQSFSPDPEVTITAHSLGMDFLTWLLFFWETGKQTFTIDERHGSHEYSMMMEGPAVFFLEGEGAHETALRRGMPILSREAKTALEAGKKLRRINLTIARGDDVYEAAVDGLDFGFRSLKLPKPEGEAYDPGSILQERMLGVQAFTGAFYSLFVRFLRTMEDTAEWKKTVTAMKKWISNRKTLV